MTEHPDRPTIPWPDDPSRTPPGPAGQVSFQVPPAGPPGAMGSPPWGQAPPAPPWAHPTESTRPIWVEPVRPPGQPPAALATPGGSPSKGTARILIAAAGVGLTAGLLGGGAAYLVGDRLASRPNQPALPAPIPGITTRPDGSIAKIAATALPSVVTVKIKGPDGSGTGSGFVIDTAGHVLTNNHVVSSVAASGSIRVVLADGASVDATIVGRDASYDLAVLHVARTDLTPLTFGRSADVVVGDGVIAVGAPLGLEATVTSGIVSALNRPVAAGDGGETSYINAIQTDAAINPGNSGGPLLDMNGKVIGVNSAIARIPGTSSTGGNIGVGFSIPSDQAFKTAQQLISTGKALHPVIGVSLDARYDGEGARIVSPGGVTPNSPAAAAGLRDGDVVVEFDGRKITTRDDLVVAIRAHSVGDTVHLKVDRDGQRLDLTMTLQAAG
ncbi:MAG: trypsin-like peptidase domain-containing protein [Dermatophilaceae bacterium]